MQFLKYRSRGGSVAYLQELLGKLGYSIPATGYFGRITEGAVKDFQSKNNLVIDGLVGLKTWTVLLSKTAVNLAIEDKFLSEKDLIDFAGKFDLKLAAVKAVNQIESSGKGFLADKRPKILFEGHIFWRQLKERGIDPASFLTEESKDVLYNRWTRKYYLGGVREYERLEKAQNLSSNPKVKEAALASASWGSYQIMGFHAVKLGYSSVAEFVSEMGIHERNHLEAFGRYLVTFGCMKHLKSLNWASFAKCYNGPGYAANKYDVKIAEAFDKFT